MSNLKLLVWLAGILQYYYYFLAVDFFHDPRKVHKSNPKFHLWVWNQVLNHSSLSWLIKNLFFALESKIYIHLALKVPPLVPSRKILWSLDPLETMVSVYNFFNILYINMTLGDQKVMTSSEMNSLWKRVRIQTKWVGAKERTI